MSESDKEQEFREEAQRLAQLSRDEQKQIIALHRSVAEDRESSWNEASAMS